MCGIAGIFHPDVPKPVDPARVAAMTRGARPSRARRQRRLDRAGRRARPPPALDHRPLRRRAAADADRRPARSRSASTARSTISARCARELEAKGHGFRTESDTEVILAAWRQWGADCLSRLNGMFAFALYDADQRCAVPRPRPARGEAAFLCRAGRRRLDLRLRAQGPARPSAAAPRRRSRRRSRIISPSATSPTMRSIVEGVEQAARPAIICSSAAASAVPRAGAMVGRRLRQPRTATAEGARRGDGRAAARGGHARGWSPTCRSAPSSRAGSTARRWSPSWPKRAAARSRPARSASTRPTMTRPRYAAQVAELFATDHRSRTRRRRRFRR